MLDVRSSLDYCMVTTLSAFIFRFLSLIEIQHQRSKTLFLQLCLLFVNGIFSDFISHFSTSKQGCPWVDEKDDFGVVGMHHVGILCENLERSLDFYQNILGLEINEARPHDKLPYRGAWLWVGSEMIHLMELPNPDPSTGRPEHGGRDRHTCIAIRDVSKLKDILDRAGIPYTLSRSGRPAIFTRDPDTNALEFTQV
ncbi:uncharacterized protein LOC110694050 [Chenopodium quinoa]|uniref:uncharacterized protein LOC110694050 n=1 Tax=Chenopodium quinoa TaxID=63459 RepID=UPI000B787D7E|nr:uncharacterized protein LOC110694050 [Chenopodium quinoa]